MDILKEVAQLRRMKVSELRARYEEVFGEPTRSGHREFLIRKIAWRLQAMEEGGLTERARRRAGELANDLDIRTRPPAMVLGACPTGRTRSYGVNGEDARLPTPGTVISRDYKGRSYHVKVLARGFEYESRSYRSLSAIAKEITGSHWNGFVFFGLSRKERRA